MDITSATIETLKSLVNQKQDEAEAYRSHAKILKEQATIKARTGNRIAKEAEEIKKIIEMYKNQ